MADLLELAARCEAATGPDRELDIAIHTLIDPRHVAMMDAHYAETKAVIEAMGPEAVMHRLPDLRSDTHRPPRYTASLDAAVTLVPEGWGWTAARYWCEGEDKPPYFADCGDLPAMKIAADDITIVQAWAQTPVLALCAAALRARTPSAVLQHGGGA